MATAAPIHSYEHIHGDNPYLARSYGNLDIDAMTKLYDEWASTYDKDVIEGEEYKAPPLIAQTILKNLSPSDKIPSPTGSSGDAIISPSVKILDAGCGTGLVGVYLAQLGAKHVDGIDLSPGMLTLARKTGAYNRLEPADLTNPIQAETGSYDVVSCVGTFTAGHVGPQCLDELVRVTRVGGLVVATVLDEIWKPLGFEERVKGLKEQGKVEVVGTELMLYRTKHKAAAREVVLRKK
ncbi:S-adenosyl-L-methionine-dependent methyltransferase [Plenodomus tracheiphilus IPT5]|uniref:S-adenosyl-L-methionine-dependent methyltransferase n=1 Tax=Plenodomus tracheiphilus IPT5 TaxID=1408161 RepID=A0A6A7ATD0_9PLEO|nr:S-adenosyl-L-methionine-dependent methyltransferase [Plenodomus tracheiphilus IPT5]